MKKVFELDDQKCSENLMAVFESLRALWPGEIEMVSCVRFFCSSQRAAKAVELFTDVKVISGSGVEIPESPRGMVMTKIKVDELETELHPQPLCLTCGEPFEPKRANSKFCSKACAVKYYNSKYQGEKRAAEQTLGYAISQPGDLNE